MFISTKNRQSISRTTTAKRARRRAGRDPGFLLEFLENRQLLSAAVTTDKPDYEPGESVVITATGFSVGETVAFQVSRSDGSTDAAGLEAWSLRDGGADDLDGVKNGAVRTSWFVNPDALDQSFVLSVVGQSGLTASTKFTDDNGAIFTTLADGSVQNANVQYQQKEDVYLNGQHFDEGDYYIRVVQTSHQQNVGVSVLAAGTLHIDASGEFGPVSVWDLVYKSSDGSQGYDDSANAEYNVDVADNPEFTNPKQDNFRIKPDETGNPGLDVAIGGHKFNDLNANGVADPGEPGLSDWEINVDGNVVASTDADGQWFWILQEGDHTIEEVNQAGWTQTGVTIYNVGIFESGFTGVPDGGLTAFDFLNFNNVSITGTKFYDANANGVADDTDVVADWTVILDDDADPDNGNLATAQTGPDGTYSFDDLAPGTYYVYESLPAGWTQVYGQAIYTVIVGGDGIQSGGTSAGNDFGNIQQVPIGGYKYEDHNANGTEDDGDQGLAGWHILLDGIDVATTADDGSWGILVTDGNHTIQEVNQNGWTQTGVVTYNIGVSHGVVTGDVPDEGTGEFNFLNFKNVNITGTKFYDTNANGVADDAAVVANWTVVLDSDANPNNGNIATTLTLADGTFSFTNIAPGTYYVYEGMQSGWLQTYGPAAYTITVGGDGVQSGGASTGNNFGNLRLQTGPGEHTLGFWSNNNGFAVMNDGGTVAPELTLLSGLNLAKNVTSGKNIVGGTDYNPATYADFKSWLLGANGTNMAYMLSAQLATTALSVEAGFLGSGLIIDTGSLLLPYSGQVTGLNVVAGHGFISVGNLINAANTQLGIDKFTLSGDVNRPIQEALKTALDRLNNNLLLVVV